MGARILVPVVCQPPRGLACNSCRKGGSSQWREGRRWRIAWSCISAKTLKAWVFVSVSHFGSKFFFLVPHLSAGWGGGGAPTCTDTLFQSLPLLPGWFLLSTHRLGLLREIQTLATRLGWQRRLLGFPLPAAGFLGQYFLADNPTNW